MIKCPLCGQEELSPLVLVAHLLMDHQGFLRYFGYETGRSLYECPCGGASGTTDVIAAHLGQVADLRQHFATIVIQNSAAGVRP